MDDMMKGMKSFFGGKSSSMPSKGGHTLGGGDGAAPIPTTQVSHFQITFAAASLGMTLTKAADGSAEVTKLTPNSEAKRAGVRPGDRILALEGNQVGGYDDVMVVIRSLGRPLQVTFARAGPAPLPPSNRGRGSNGGMTAEQQEARRDTARKAAEARGQAWEKRLGSTRSSKAQEKKQEREATGAAGDGTVGGTSEAGRLAFEKAKNKEAAKVAQLGYNPYAPIFGSSSQGRAALDQQAEQEQQPSSLAHQDYPPTTSHNLTPTSSLSSSGPASSSDLVPGPSELDEPLAHALALLSSHPQQVCGEACDVLAKLLGNLASNFDKEKFHRVRLGNKAFNKKVGSIAGGLEVMTEAGFILSTEDGTDEPVLVFLRPFALCTRSNSSASHRALA